MRSYYKKAWTCAMIATFILFYYTFSFAQTENIKGVQFKDGSIMYGKVLKMNIYDIQIETKDGKIISRKFDEVEVFIKDNGVDANSLPTMALGSIASAQNVDVRATATTVFIERFSAELYGGYLKGQSREFVYDAATGHRISELIWSIDNAYVVGLSLALRPIERLKISVGGWIPVSSGNTMDDYDWLVTGFDDWSDWSHHTDTKLHQAYMIDTRAAFTLASLKRKPDASNPWQIRHASLDLIGGYRWFKLDWTAYGGSYVYSSGGGVRNVTGQFPDGQPVISYEQWWEAPFAGLGGRLSIDRWTLSTEVIGSLWGKGRDRDNHHLRTLLFEESFSNVGMLAVNVGINYDLTKHLAVFARFDYEKFFEGKGPTTATDYSTGAVTTFGGDAAGADFYTMLFSLGLKLRF
jgi:outer membrane protease